MEFFIKQNDRAPAIRAVLVDSNNDPVNITGAVVKFIMGQAPGSAVVNAVATPIDSTNGVVEYQWAVGDTANAGRFLAEWQVTYADGRMETFPNEGYMVVWVRAELGS